MSAPEEDLSQFPARGKLDYRSIQVEMQAISMYLSICEMLATEIMLAPTAASIEENACKSEPVTHFDDKGRFRRSAWYKREVSPLNKKDELMAAASWLHVVGAFHDGHLYQVRAFRDHRNDVAHNLARYLLDHERDLDGVLSARAFECLAHICSWRVAMDAHRRGGAAGYVKDWKLTMTPQLRVLLHLNEAFSKFLDSEESGPD